MNTIELQNIHRSIVMLYRTSILPVITNYYNSDVNTVEEKNSDNYKNTLVSKADLEINKLLFENLPKIVVGASIISEESDNHNFDEYTFIIDPIDGTHSFLRNLDDWGIIIELCHKNEVIYSVIFYPNSKTEFYYAIKGLGAFDSDNNKIKINKFFNFKPSFVCAPASRKVGRSLIEYAKGKMLSFRAYGSCAYAAYTLLRGGNDFIFFDDLNIWDILGCTFIAKQAGFVVTWYSDEPKLDNTEGIKNKRYRLLIHKPDYDTAQIEEIKSVIQKALIK